jgi:hypothetical protein
VSFSENLGGPGVVGVGLGLLVLLGFGGLTMAVWDGRLNGENATKLRDMVNSQDAQILGIKGDITRAQEDILYAKRKEVALDKLESLNKVVEASAEKREEMKQAVAEAEKAIGTIGEDQIAYRDKYRVYGRERAIGEEFEELELRDGKVLKQVTLRRISPNKVAFGTQYGSTSVTWEELPESWSSRFQIGEGEIEEHNQRLAEVRLARSEHMADIREDRMADLKLMEKKRNVATIGNNIQSGNADILNVERRIAQLESKESEYKRRGRSASTKGARNMHYNLADKTDQEIRELRNWVKSAKSKIRELKKERSTLQRELERELADS